MMKKDLSTDLHVQEQAKEKYQFIREQTLPQRRRKVKNILLKGLGLIAVAGIFGLVSGGTFLLVNQWGTEKEIQPVEIPMATFLPESVATIEPDKKADKDYASFSVQKESQVAKKIAAVGNVASGAIVGVESKEDTQNWFTQNRRNAQKKAAGVVWEETDSEYIIVTTSHIVKEDSAVRIRFKNEVQMKGKLLGIDSQLNIAVISIKKSKVSESTKKSFCVADIATATGMPNGSTVIAIGSPNGVLYSVMIGHIVNNSVYGAITDGEIELLSTDINYFEDSTGVVVNNSGKVVGIISTDFTKETGKATMAFLNVSDVRVVIERLKAQESIPYMGMEGQSVSAEAARLRGIEMGAYVTSVYSGSPAYRSGLRVGDVIIDMDDQSVTGLKECYHILLRHRSKDTINYTVLRKANKVWEKKKLKIKLG